MSGQDALEELQLNIEEAIKEELLSSQRPRLDKAFTTKYSVRDLGQHLESSANHRLSRTELLESWQSLVQNLSLSKVYIQYTPQLEHFFVSLMSLDDDSDWENIKILLDLMTETIKNYDKDPSTECRYVTLMEVLSTYEQNWEMSEQIQRLWEMNDHLVDPSESPEEFRESAYGVMMLLPWVPNSGVGLRQACTIADDESIDDDEVPWAVESIFDQIKSNPLPRHDAVHRILSHLENQDNAIVAITSKVDASFHESSSRCHGLGKTTMAAIVASSPQVQADHDVLWLQLKHRKGDSVAMTYQHYVEYLNALCEQLDLDCDWPKPMRVLEERALQKKREEETMFQLKTEMANILRENTSDLLLILDDVHEDQEIEWFRFLDQQLLVVTTQSHNLSVSWTLDVELLSEDEALELLLTEAGYSSDDAIGNSLEAKSIVQRCGYHPLTIRMVARLFALKEATVGAVKALEELDQELGTCTTRLRHSHSLRVNPEFILPEVMNLTLSPILTAGGQPTSLMKTCLSSMAVVFEKSVPYEVVILLWGALFQTEPQVIGELGDGLSASKIRKRVRFIMEALISLGILMQSEKDEKVYVEIAHTMQSDYAKSLAKEIHFGVDETETAERWHNAFVDAYLTKKTENELDDAIQEYAIEKLGRHMIRARRFKKVVKLLTDERFLVERFASKGFEEGTRLQLDDCAELLNVMETDGTNDKDPFELVASIHIKVAAFVISEAQGQDDELLHEAGMAINELCFALTESGFSPEAMVQYKSALKIVSKRSKVSSVLLYGMGALNLIRNELTKGLKNLNECLKGMVKGEKVVNELYSEALLLKGDVLLAQCDYEGALQVYNESLDALAADSTKNRVEIGIALYRKGVLHFTKGEQEHAIRALDDSIALKLKIGESSANLATAYYFVGHIYAENKRNAQAIENFESALRMMKENLDEVDNADIYLTTGKLCELRDDIDGCLDAFDLALREIRDSPRMEMDRAVHDLRSIASVSAALGDYVGALPIFDEGLDLTEDRPHSLERASLLFELALCESKQGDHEEAVYHLQQSLKIRKDKLGPSEVAIQTLMKLGETYKSMGILEEALSYYNDALESTEIAYGQDNEKVASLLFTLGDIKESTGDIVEALANFEECLEMRRRNLEITSVLIAEVVEKVGSIYSQQGNSEKAYHCFAEALDIRQASSEPDDPALAESFYRIGLAARKQGDSERALHFLLDALRIREKQEQERQMCETLVAIGHVHRQLNDHESALSCYEKCLEIVQESFGESDILVGDLLVSIGGLYRINGIADLALKSFEEALPLQINHYSRDHIKVAVASWGIGMVKYEMDDYEEALKNLSDFVKIQDTNKKRNADYVIALQVVGDIHQFLENSESARSAWSAAFHTYSSSKEMVSRYPELGPMLERRITACGEETESQPSQAETMLQTFTANLVGQLSEEVTKRDKMERDPAEGAFQRAIFLEEWWPSE